MSETVTVDLDTYLKYKECYENDFCFNRERELLNEKIYPFISDNNTLSTQLYKLKLEMNTKLENYNKAKHGIFADKLNFLFSKE